MLWVLVYLGVAVLVVAFIVGMWLGDGLERLFGG